MRHALVLPVLILTAACTGTGLPPPTPDNNLVECRDLARIESGSNQTLTDRFTAQSISRQIGCPRFVGSLID